MEKRITKRLRMLLAGKLVYGDGAFSLDCTIRDLTEVGARVSLTSPELLPSTLHLVNVHSGLAHRSTIIWRRLPLIGLHFEETYDLREPGAPELKWLRKIWLEAAAR